MWYDEAINTYIPGYATGGAIEASVVAGGTGPI